MHPVVEFVAIVGVSCVVAVLLAGAVLVGAPVWRALFDRGEQ